VPIGRDPCDQQRRKSARTPERCLVSIDALQQWTRLAAVASFVVVLDLLVVATALTAMRRDLGASIGQLEWTINGYTLSLAVLLMAAAALGDRVGRRRGFAFGLALFGIASAPCALVASAGSIMRGPMSSRAGATTRVALGNDTDFSDRRTGESEWSARTGSVGRRDSARAD
jgi:Major Facilitator Superfamily